jgi:hypothetical protein
MCLLFTFCRNGRKLRPNELPVLLVSNICACLHSHQASTTAPQQHSRLLLRFLQAPWYAHLVLYHLQLQLQLQQKQLSCNSQAV